MKLRELPMETRIGVNYVQTLNTHEDDNFIRIKLSYLFSQREHYYSFNIRYNQIQMYKQNDGHINMLYGV